MHRLQINRWINSTHLPTALLQVSTYATAALENTHNRQFAAYRILATVALIVRKTNVSLIELVYYKYSIYSLHALLLCRTNTTSHHSLLMKWSQNCVYLLQLYHQIPQTSQGSCHVFWCAYWHLYFPFLQNKYSEFSFLDAVDWSCFRGQIQLKQWWDADGEPFSRSSCLSWRDCWLDDLLKGGSFSSGKTERLRELFHCLSNHLVRILERWSSLCGCNWSDGSFCWRQKQDRSQGFRGSSIRWSTQLESREVLDSSFFLTHDKTFSFFFCFF